MVTQEEAGKVEGVTFLIAGTGVTASIQSSAMLYTDRIKCLYGLPTKGNIGHKFTVFIWRVYYDI